jgi:hypothetical protein
MSAIPKEILSYSVLTTEAGQEVMSNLKKVFGSNAPAFIANAEGNFDPLKAAIRDGQRQVILHIEACIHRSTHEAPKTKTARKD